MLPHFTLVRDILEIYENHNPAFVFIIPEANPPIVPYLHQIEFTLRILLRKPLRVFIADEIGLGKTITALAILRRIWNLGFGRKILIAVPRILLSQWISELRRLGFGHWIKRIERDTIDQLIYEGFPDGIYIASMDLIKRDRYFSEIEKVPWDVVIVDEAHKLGKGTERFNKIGVGLIGNFPDRNVILLSATPHRGDPKDYLCRISILDPYLEAGDYLDNISFYSLTHNVLIFRRSKIDVNEIYEKRKVFTDCHLEAIVIPATLEEEDFHRRLVSFLRTKLFEYYYKIGETPRAIGLLTALIFKRASSSPFAAMRTLENMIHKRSELLKQLKAPPTFREFDQKARSIANTVFGLGFDDYSEYYDEYEEESIEPDEVLNEFAERCSIFLTDNDVRELTKLVDLAKTISKRDSRLGAVKLLVDKYLREGRKVIIFTEYKDTAKYVYKALIEEFGNRRVVKLTSDEVRNEKLLERIRRRFEQEADCMVATDVASEGLNLQVASVVINYEAPWSPVKLEQRMGRVWRLGQVRDVIIHTVFLAIDTDRDVLDILYRKLIALGRAIGTKKSPVGEEVVVINMHGEELPLPLGEFTKGKRKIRLTEHALIQEYIRGGREALSDLIEHIVQTIRKLREDLRRFNVLPRIDRERTKRLIELGVGFSDSRELFEVLKTLLKSLLNNAKQQGIDIQFKEEGGKLMVISSGGAPIKVDDCTTVYKMIKMLLRRGAFTGEALKTIPYIVARDAREGELRIYEITIYWLDKEGNEYVLYKEPIGLYLEEGYVRVVRGAELLKLISKAIDNLAFTANEYTIETPEETELLIFSKLKTVGQEIVRKLSDDFIRYRKNLAARGWRESDDEWCPRARRCTSKPERLMGIIRFTSITAARREARIDLFTKKLVEREAMKFAMKYEIEQGRKPIDVSDKEHYDILSRDPRKGVVRYIEVKGHKGPSLIAELSEYEYEIAKEKGDNYWLYIIHSIATGNPQLVAIRNPLKNMKVEVIESRKYRLTP